MKLRGILCIILAAVLTCSCAHAQTLIIRDATVYTMTSQSALLGGDVLVRDGKINEVGLDLSAPANALEINAGGRLLTPGLFAGVSSLGLVEISAEEATVDDSLALTSLRPEFDVTTAYNPYSMLIPVTRIEGFTWTLLGARSGGSIISGQGSSVVLDGKFDTFVGTPVLFIDVGADTSHLTGDSRAAQWMLLNQAVDEARSKLQWSPASVLTVAGRKILTRYVNTDRAVVFDVDRASDIVQVLRFADERNINPVIRGGAEAWKVADLLAETGTPVMVNPLQNLPSNFDSLGARLDNAAMLNASGVIVAYFHADSLGHNARSLRQAAGVAVANGMPYQASLAALTANPARIFGLDHNLGSLKPGMRADMVLWSGDPLEVTTAADQVFIGGVPIEMVSRQTLLRDRYLEQNPTMPKAYIKPKK